MRRSGSADFGEYLDDPGGFARDVLGVELWEKQEEIARALIDNPRVAVASCFAAGKTFLAAVLVIWWLCSREQALVITTAPTLRQVRDLLWRELRKLWGGAKKKLPGKPLQLKWEIAADRQALGFSAGNPVGAQGFHEKNTLVVEDEAAGIDADLSNTLEGAMVSPECRRLKIGNPESMDGPFYEVFHGRVSEDWKRFSISAFDSPNVTAGRIVVHGLVGSEWIDMKRREFGEESNYWRTKVLGQFPLDVVERLIPMDWIRAAQERWKDMEDSTPRVLGGDIARGGDKTALAKRFGRKIHMGRVWQEPDVMQSVAEIVRTIDADGYDQANIDETAVGGGAVDRVKEIQKERAAANPGCPLATCKIRGFIWSAKPRKAKKFRRLSDELWWNVRNALNPDPILNPEPIGLPPDEELAAQLNCRTYQTLTGGLIAIETKNDLKKKKVKSPDKADAVALCLHKPKEIVAA